MSTSEPNMMRKNVKVVSFAICVIAAVGVAFVFGLNVGRKGSREDTQVVLDSDQFIAAYNRLDEERKIQSWLYKGCMDSVRQELDVDEDQDTKLLADFSKGTLVPWARKYVLDRDPKLLDSLSTFKSKYGNSWEIKECK